MPATSKVPLQCTRYSIRLDAMSSGHSGQADVQFGVSRKHGWNLRLLALILREQCCENGESESASSTAKWYLPSAMILCAYPNVGRYRCSLVVVRGVRWYGEGSVHLDFESGCPHTRNLYPTDKGSSFRVRCGGVGGGGGEEGCEVYR